MKITITRIQEISFKYILVSIPNTRHALKYKLPNCLKRGKPYPNIEFLIDVDEQKILEPGEDEWSGGAFELYAQVDDKGSYQLMNEEFWPASDNLKGYVPDCIPNDFNHAIYLKILKNGTISNMNLKNDSFEEFFN